MSLDDQLRAVLNEEADLRTATPPDVGSLISGGRARRRRRNAAWAAGGVLAAVIAAGGVYGVVQVGDDTDSVSRIAHQPAPRALQDTPVPVAIDPGTYLVEAGDHVVAPYTITVPAGWYAQNGIVIGKHQDQPLAVGIEPFVLDRILLTDDTCTGPETFGTARAGTAGLVAGLRAQGSGVWVSHPVPDTVGGLAATRIDLDYPGRKPLSNCRLSMDAGGEPGVLQVWVGYFVLFPAESASVYVVDVGDRSQVFVTRTREGAFAADRRELRSVLDSISFQTGAE